MLDIRNLSFSYGSTQALKDVSLSLKENEILAVVGESGSGKSTMLRCILGLAGSGGSAGRRLCCAGSVPRQGEILFEGKNLLGMTDKQMRGIRGHEIAMVFQHPSQSFDPVTKIGRQAFEAARAHEKISRWDVERRMCDLLAEMNITEPDRVLSSYPFELSGGMCQRAALALAMMFRPKLLLADEPTSALDVTVQAQVIRSMQKLRREYKTAILIVTHNIGVAAYMADCMAVMYQGQIVEYGNTKALIRNPRHAYSQKLIASVPVLEVNHGGVVC